MKSILYFSIGVFLAFFLFWPQTSTAATSDNVGISWQDDRRLGAGVTPWNNPAAAVLYCGIGPIRPYAVGDYICTDIYNGFNVANRLYIVGVEQMESLGSERVLYITKYPRFNGAAVAGSTIFYNKDYTLSTGQYIHASALGTLQTWPSPTCSDNVWNGDETGIDCGGSTCDPCETPQTGLTDQEKAQALAGVLVGFAVLLCVVTGIG